MDRPPLIGGTLRFGPYEADARARVLRKHGLRIHLQDRSFALLAALLEHPGELLTREELVKQVWPAGVFIDFENGLNSAINRLRDALRDRARRPRYIETLGGRGYRFIARVEQVPAGEKKSPDRLMLAVLPLENHSMHQDQEYLVDGLTDEVITRLGRLSPRRLGVIARTSAMQYKRTCKAIDQIGRELGVDYLVGGAVRREGDRVRLTAQLIRVSDCTQVWSNSYQRRLQDVFLLQDELASAIADEVEVNLVPEKAQRAARQRRVNHEAYEACLKARYLWNRRTRHGLYQALELFSTAIHIDPDFAPAFAGLADVYLVLLDYRHLAPNESLGLSMAAATNALRLDQGLADAHTSLGHARMHALDWEEAEREFLQAIHLSSGYAPAHFYYGNFLLGQNRPEEAIAEARETLKLDPVSMAAESNLAVFYYITGRLDEALESCRRALELEPALPRPHDDLGRILLEKGAFPGAVAALEKSVSLADREPRYLSSLGYAYGVSGKVDAARGILTELADKAEYRYVAASDFALVNVGLGELDQAFYWLERAYCDRDSHLPFLHVDPRFSRLNSDTRFRALLARSGVTPREPRTALGKAPLAKQEGVGPRLRPSGRDPS